MAQSTLPLYQREGFFALQFRPNPGQSFASFPEVVPSLRQPLRREWQSPKSLAKSQKTVAFRWFYPQRSVH